tara:strand:- start:795 stop:1934 length:1140 start_codon:yes stop_codon:yes gene_type:complete
MGLLGTTTQESYYNQSQTFTGNGSTTIFTLTNTSFPTIPSAETDFEVFINEILITPSNYDYGVSGTNQLRFTSTDINTEVQESTGAPKNALKILVREISDTEQYGNYQFISIEDLINNFIVSYVGEGKIISRVRKADVAFHAQRGIQEFSYDTFKSTKSQEIEIPPTLTMVLPQDYVNYVKISWKDSGGLERRLYPSRDTSNPTALLQDSNYKYLFDNNGNIQRAFNSETWDSFSSANTSADESNDSIDPEHLSMYSEGKRYGIIPEYSQSNGVFFIDQQRGLIHFSSNIVNKVVTLKYISDGLGTDSEMLIHKFAEEAMYKYLAYAVLSSKSNIPEFIVNRFRKERFAATRKAKLRLSNLKAEELTQVMRNKSKQIKH